MNIKYKILTLLLIVFSVGCETTNLDLLDNPNNINPRWLTKWRNELRCYALY